MAKPDITYDTLTNNETNPFVDLNKKSPQLDDDTETEETPQNSGIMIHVVTETHKTRWNHIEDLDSFFTRMYCYHQKHGFHVMMLQEVLELFQFVFVVTVITYMLHCVDYPILFNDNNINNNNKISLSDALYTPSQCATNLGGGTWLALFFSGFFWLFRVIKVFYHFIQFWDIKMFFNTALKIDDNELDNLTWHEVQKRVREVQSEQQMCIHKEQLTELDIYHRILRFKNYMVAMMNKSLLPSTIKLPLLGNVVCMSRALRYNIELILFWGPWSPFENNWHLREEFKRSNKRIELSNKLSKQIFWVAVANIVLCPIVFLWQLMYFFFNYVDLIKKEPNTLGLRCWSQYGKLYLRHFNELDHELDARLTRAYRPAVKYMNSFSSPLMTVIAKNVSFMFGGILSIFVFLSIYDEDVLQVQHVVTIVSVLTVIVVSARSVIPDENMIWCPEQLLRNVLAHVHYLPASWRGFAHTSKVRESFEQYFQLKAMYILNELFSPLVTPFVLLWIFRPKALDIVDFYRNFTVSVVGVGDVCSFAQMDVRKHGNPDWQITNSAIEKEVLPADNSPIIETNQYTQGEHGKTELSLVHFTLTNPTWKMPAEAKHFVQGIKRHAIQDLNRQRGVLQGITNPTAMEQSLLSVESLGGEYSSIIQSIIQTHNLSNSQQIGLSLFNINTAGGGGGGYTHPPFNPNATAQSSYQSHMNSPPSFDFERMLQQNLTDGSTAPLRSMFLHDINENDDENAAAGDDPENPSHSRMEQSIDRPSASQTGSQVNCMSFSTRGGMTKREGPPEGSKNGLLYSLYGEMPSNAPQSKEFLATDMCLSTLYLHELHHNHMRRRGATLHIDASQRQIWQRPHQQQSQMPVSASTSTSQYTSTAERTPLLGSNKKS